jgi:hypothetical protein
LRGNAGIFDGIKMGRSFHFAHQMSALGAKIAYVEPNLTTSRRSGGMYGRATVRNSNELVFREKELS